MANKRPLVLDDVGSGAGALREAGDGECANLINSPYCTYGGTANAITLTVNDSLGKPSAYVAGAQYRFRATAVNTGASTVNIEGLGAKTLVTVTGVALPAGYIRTGVDTTITYDAVSDRFVAGREIERGSNVNGTYTRLADGTQTCLKQDYIAADRTIANGVLYRTADYIWVYPAAFVGIAVLTGKPVTGGIAVNGWLGLGTSGESPGNQGSFSIHGSISVGGTGTVTLKAQGTWY